MGAIAGIVPLIGGAAGGAGALGGFGTILQLGFGIVSAIGQMRAGEAEANAIKAQSEANARQAEVQAAGERTQGEVDSAARSRDLLVLMAQQDAAISASGFRPTSGSFVAAQEETQRQGEQEIQRGSTLSNINAQLLTQQAQTYRASGAAGASAAKSAGRMAAFSTVGGTLVSISKRGSVPEA
jgi:hypothetical protein